jgi:hypothetical protein
VDESLWSRAHQTPENTVPASSAGCEQVGEENEWDLEEIFKSCQRHTFICGMAVFLDSSSQMVTCSLSQASKHFPFGFKLSFPSHTLSNREQLVTILKTFKFLPSFLFSSLKIK